MGLHTQQRGSLTHCVGVWVHVGGVELAHQRTQNLPHCTVKEILVTFNLVVGFLHPLKVRSKCLDFHMLLGCH